MSLFRSEEDVRAWSQRRGIAVGAIFDLERLWKVARVWYADRFDANWCRKTVPERQALLDAAGLHGPFWRLSREPAS